MLSRRWSPIPTIGPSRPASMIRSPGNGTIPFRNADFSSQAARCSSCTLAALRAQAARTRVDPGADRGPGKLSVLAHHATRGCTCCLSTRRARVSCGVCSEPEIGCVRRTAVRTRSEHLPNIWGIRGFQRIHICPGNRTFCETLPDARAPSHGGNPGSNPGSGIDKMPANT